MAISIRAVHLRPSSFTLVFAGTLLFLFGITIKAYTHVYSWLTVPLVVDESVPGFLPQSSKTLSAPEDAPRILLVTAFYPLENSRHDLLDYANWLANLMVPITTDIYVFTTLEMENLVRQLRGDLPVIVDISYPTPFDIPPLKSVSVYEDIHQASLQSGLSPDLFAVLAGKPFYLHEGVKSAMTNHGKVYDYAFWIDAGAFKEDHRYTGWPDGKRIKAIWEEGSRLTNLGEDDMLFFPMKNKPDSSMKKWKEADGPIHRELSQTSFFGGTPYAIAWYRVVYYAYQFKFLIANQPIGDPSHLTSSLLLLFSSRIITVWPSDPHAPGYTSSHHLSLDAREGPLGRCGSPEAYHQFFVAGEEEREQSKAAWVGEWGGWRWWRWWATEERERCRETRVVGFLEALRGEFGGRWDPPRPSLDV